jgi:hypothetical protein
MGNSKRNRSWFDRLTMSGSTGLTMSGSTGLTMSGLDGARLNLIDAFQSFSNRRTRSDRCGGSIACAVPKPSDCRCFAKEISPTEEGVKRE